MEVNPDAPELGQRGQVEAIRLAQPAAAVKVVAELEHLSSSNNELSA